MIEERLRKWLMRDRKGIRRECLRILLEGEKTVKEIYEELKRRGYKVSLKGVAALIGKMHPTLGIVKITFSKSLPSKYTVKPEYVETVKKILEEAVEYDRYHRRRYKKA